MTPEEVEEAPQRDSAAAHDPGRDGNRRPHPAGEVASACARPHQEVFAACYHILARHTSRWGAGTLPARPARRGRDAQGTGGELRCRVGDDFEARIRRKTWALVRIPYPSSTFMASWRQKRRVAATRSCGLDH